MEWRLTGQLIESCSCNMFCPCWFGVQELMVMDQGWCDNVLAFRVHEGQADGVSLAGRTVVLGVDFPGPTLFDGNATARLYIDAGTSAEQRRALEAIFQGQQGGPMGALAPLITKWLATQSANIEVQEEGDTLTVAVDNAGQVRSQRLRDAQGQTFTLQGGGFVAGFGLEAAELAPSSSRWADPEFPREFETKSGARGTFNWSA